jgi:ferredoxin
VSIWVLRGLRDGVVTTRWPRRPDEYADSWRGPVTVRPEAGGAGLPDGLCPTGAIMNDDGRIRVDQGKCVLCGRCVAARPDLFAWSAGTTGPGAAALARPALVVPRVPETEEAIAAARASLAERTAALRRSVHVRHVDAGSDGSVAAIVPVDVWVPLFLLMALGAAVPVSVAFASWAAKPKAPATRMLAVGYALALGAVVVIMTAQDAFTFLFGWETLTVASWMMAGANRADRDPSRTGTARPPCPPGSGARHRGVREGKRGRAARRHVALDHAGVVHACAGRRGEDDGAGAAAGGVRGEGRAGAVPDLDAARLRGRARPGLLYMLIVLIAVIAAVTALA